MRIDFPPLASAQPSSDSIRLTLPAFACGDESYAGREAALARIDEAWRRTLGGVRHVVFVAGEPGIGKTRLAAEASRRVFGDNVTILYGRCDEETVVPYQPFVEALRPYVALAPPAELRQQLHGLASDLARSSRSFSGRSRTPPG